MKKNTFSLNYKEFINLPISNIKAYLLGLFVTKIVIAKNIDNNEIYLLGQVNHGHQNKPSESDLMDHYLMLKKFLKSNQINVDIFFNKSLMAYSIKSGTFKKINGIGFAIALEIKELLNENTNSISSDFYKEIRDVLLDECNKLSNNNAPYFIAGTIDGRSSIDTTMKCVSVDIDTDNNLNIFLKEFIEKKCDFEINLNDRNGRSDSSRMNQLRYKKNTIKVYYQLHYTLILSSFRLQKIVDTIV